MDATEEAILRFNDESAWDKVKDGVPVFMPHKRVVKIENPDGTVKEQTIDVGPERLAKIAKEMQKQWLEFGMPVTFYEGHTKDPFKVDQKDQPAVLGYGINPRLGMSRGKQVIFVKQYILPGFLEKAKQLPHRSAEFTPGTNGIPGVAMLKTPPWLNMGVVLYDGQEKAFKANRCLPYQSQSVHRVYLYMGDEVMPDPMAAPNANEQSDMEFDGKCANYMQRNYPHMNDMHTAYAATLSPTNSDLPAPVDGGVTAGSENPMADKTVPDEKYQAALQRITVLERTIQYSGELAGMVRDGAKIDYQAELNYAAGLDGEPGLTPAQFARHKAILKQSTAPVGGNLLPTKPSPVKAEEITRYQAKQDTVAQTDVPAQAPSEYTPENMKYVDAAIQYQRDHPGTSYDAAWACVVKS